MVLLFLWWLQATTQPCKSPVGMEGIIMVGFQTSAFLMQRDGVLCFIIFLNLRSTNLEGLEKNFSSNPMCLCGRGQNYSLHLHSQGLEKLHMD